MKHLKTFENTAGSVKFTIAKFNGDDDDVIALYADDVLVFYGDYYHNKISDKIGGFFEGLEFSKFVFSKDTLDVTDTDLIERVTNGENPPINLSEIK